MTLLSGTLEDLDVASIASVTGLGRSRLRLELREADGRLIGSLVLKAGRVVSASAGGKHGHDALRIIMSSAGNTRFQLAHEPLDFVLSSALASVDELWSLRPGRRSTRSTRLPAQGADRASSNGIPREQPTPRSMPVERPSVRALMMQGRLEDFDLLTLLQTIGMGRQVVEIEVRDRAGRPQGVVSVKSGKVIAARCSDATGMGAISQLLSAPTTCQFAAFRVELDVSYLEEVASISELGVRFARGTTEMSARTVMEGWLSEFDIPTLLQTLGATRQHCVLEIHGERASVGRIFMKSGVILSASASKVTGVPAIQYLMTSPHHDRFRVVRLTNDLPDEPHLGPIARILLDIHSPPRRVSRAEASVPVAVPTRHSQSKISRVSRISQAAIAAPLGDSATSMPLPEPVMMAGSLTDFDLRTLLGVLASTRQHARLQILDYENVQIAEMTLKAGWLLSAQTGMLQGKAALAFLLGTSRQLRFRVLTGVRGAELAEPIGAISALLAESVIAPAPPPDTASRILRWAIPLSFFVGGAIVFVAVRGSNDRPASGVPATKLAPVSDVQRVDPDPAASAPAVVRTPPAAVITPPAATTAPAVVQPPVPARPAAAPRPAPTIEIEDRSPTAAALPPRTSMSVKNAQSALKALGYDPGPIDNIYGRLTRSAIARLQRAQRLPVTGYLDQETWSAIVAQLVP